EQFALEVLAICDDLGGQLIEEKGGLHDAAAHRIALALPQASAIRHGTKKVVNMANAPVDRGLHLGERGKRMAGVAADAAFSAGADESFGSGKLRGDRCRTNTISVIK